MRRSVLDRISPVKRDILGFLLQLILVAIYSFVAGAVVQVECFR